jgi:hypothetical protein
MAKAFDTVRHDNMNLVYKFFNVGTWLTNALNTISTGRTAVVLLENGLTTQPFSLGTGFPQGNPPSPNQFNMSDQIFLFKLELDSRIQKIIPTPSPRLMLALDGGRPPVPVPLPVPVPGIGPVQVAGGRGGDAYTVQKNHEGIPVPLKLLLMMQHQWES